MPALRRRVGHRRLPACSAAALAPAGPARAGHRHRPRGKRGEGGAGAGAGPGSPGRRARPSSAWRPRCHPAPLTPLAPRGSARRLPAPDACHAAWALRGAAGATQRRPVASHAASSLGIPRGRLAGSRPRRPGGGHCPGLGFAPASGWHLQKHRAPTSTVSRRGDLPLPGGRNHALLCAAVCRRSALSPGEEGEEVVWGELRLQLAKSSGFLPPHCKAEAFPR